LTEMVVANAKYRREITPTLRNATIPTSTASRYESCPFGHGIDLGLGSQRHRCRQQVRACQLEGKSDVTAWAEVLRSLPCGLPVKLRPIPACTPGDHYGRAIAWQ
jgi:hypothetical protein